MDALDAVLKPLLITPGALHDHVGHFTVGVGPPVPNPLALVVGDTAHDHLGFAVIVTVIIVPIIG